MITFKAKTASGEIIKSKLSPFTFPAGEAHTKIEDRREYEPTEIAIIQPSKSSLHNDLFQLAMWADTISYTGTTKKVAVLPYMPGARADRGVPFGLGVYADFLKNLDLNQIILFDPHSDETHMELANSTWLTITTLGSEIIPSMNLPFFDKQYDAVIAPDKGAKDRAAAFAAEISCPVVTVEKTRDFETGKLMEFKVPDLDPKGKYLIVDDICDGGGTFIGIAEKLGLPKEQLDLFVSHGVFSKGVYELEKHFGIIYTTNSYVSGLSYPDVEPFDIIRPMIAQIK